MRLRETFSKLPDPLVRLIKAVGEDLGGYGEQQIASAPDPTYRPNRKLQPNEIQDLIEQYQAGASIEQLAKQFGMHTQTVAAHLNRNSVPRCTQLKMTPDLVERGAALYAEGWSTTQIGREFGISPVNVLRALRRAGVVIRTPAEGRWGNRKG